MRHRLDEETCHAAQKFFNSPEGVKFELFWREVMPAISISAPEEHQVVAQAGYAKGFGAAIDYALMMANPKYLKMFREMSADEAEASGE